MIVSVAYFIVYFSVFLLLLGLLYFNRKRYHYNSAFQPRISILIAARNEEHSILRCLTAIDALEYPKDKIEVLIGNDDSDDDTQAVVNDFIQGKPNYSCVTITDNLGSACGKANVLAHLTRLATSDFFFFTDADIAVPPTWVQTMLAPLTDKVGVVTGITTITGNRLTEKLQSLDWIYSLGLVQVVSDIGLPVTSMGNNMVLRREAYEQTGGFENIPFSITEDIVVFNEVLKHGWDFRNIYSRDALALSLPANSLYNYLHQRKRWMSGTMHLPLYMAIIFIVHAAYYPVLLPFFIYTSVASMAGIFVLKLILQSIFINICLRRLRLSIPWWLYIMFEVYMVIASIIMILFFLLPSKTVWKGRKY
jgi:cellulose synthase/poly-beta-1,6-N-acetylglucosamine synthase-like glycosyltransferase